jgi:hypothetical protein
MPVATIAGRRRCRRPLPAWEADRYGIDRRRMANRRGGDRLYLRPLAPHRAADPCHWFGTSHLLTPDHFDFNGDTHRIFHLGLPGVHRLMDGPWKNDANGWVTTLRKARAAGLLTNIELASIAPERLTALVRPCLPISTS